MTSLPSRLRISFLTLLTLLQIALGQAPARAQEDNKPPKGFKALFNGHDIENWTGATEDPKKIAAMSSEERAAHDAKMRKAIHDHWKVKDSILISDGKDPFLSTTRDYGDFEMWVDWKIGKLGDSGIYLRGTPQVQIWDPNDPEKQKLGCAKGSGALWNNKNHERFPPVVADNPVGEWNRMYIRMVGPYVTVKLNSKKTVDNVPFENYYDPKIPVYARGPIYLQTHTTETFFRNVFVREIAPKEANKLLDKIGGKSADFKPIFNGKDLAGWTGATQAYNVVDGTLVAKEGKHGNMFTDDTYDNFAIRLEFKLPPAGNNGLALRSPITDKEVAYEGMESQILDDTNEKYKDLHPYQAHGSLYGLAPAIKGYLRPVGQWNYEELTINGDKLTVDVNGYEILNTNIAEVRKEPMDGKKHPGASPHRRPLRAPRPPRPRRIPQHPHQTLVAELTAVAIPNIPTAPGSAGGFSTTLPVNNVRRQRFTLARFACFSGVERPIPAPDTTPIDPALLKTAYNAFKKRWKLTRLDYESRIGKSPLSGSKSAIVGITAPKEFPKAIWEELVKQNRLKRAGAGLYSMP